MKAKAMPMVLMLWVLVIAGCKLSRPPLDMNFTYQPQGLCQGIVFQFSPPTLLKDSSAVPWWIVNDKRLSTSTVNSSFEVKVAATYGFWAPPDDVPVPYQYTVTCLPGGTPLSSAWPDPWAILHVTEDATQPSKLKLEYTLPPIPPSK